MANRRRWFDRIRNRSGRRRRGTNVDDLPEIEVIQLNDPPERLEVRLDGAPPVADTMAGRNGFRRRHRMPLR